MKILKRAWNFGEKNTLLMTILIFVILWSNLMQIGLNYYLSLAASIIAAAGFWHYRGAEMPSIKLPKFRKGRGKRVDWVKVSLAIIILAGFGARLYFNFRQFLPVDAGDMWDFLGDGISVAKQNRIPEEKNVFGGVPFVYPPFLSIIIATTYKIGVPVTVIPRILPPLFSIFSLFLTYKLVKYLTKDETVALLSILILSNALYYISSTFL